MHIKPHDQKHGAARASHLQPAHMQPAHMQRRPPTRTRAAPLAHGKLGPATLTPLAPPACAPSLAPDRLLDHRLDQFGSVSFDLWIYMLVSPGAFKAFINSGIVHPTGVLVVPFIGSVTSSGFGDSQRTSPFDTCPATTSLLSITNLQVAVGDQNVLQSTLQCNYEHF